MRVRVRVRVRLSVRVRVGVKERWGKGDAKCVDANET